MLVVSSGALFAAEPDKNVAEKFIDAMFVKQDSKSALELVDAKAPKSDPPGDPSILTKEWIEQMGQLTKQGAKLSVRGKQYFTAKESEKIEKDHLARWSEIDAYKKVIKNGLACVVTTEISAGANKKSEKLTLLVFGVTEDNKTKLQFITD